MKKTLFLTFNLILGFLPQSLLSNNTMKVVEVEIPQPTSQPYLYKIEARRSQGSWILQNAPKALLQSSTHVPVNVTVTWPLYQNQVTPGVVYRKSESWVLQTKSPMNPDYSEKVFVQLKINPKEIFLVPVTSVISPVGRAPYLLSVSDDQKIVKNEVELLGLQDSRLVIYSKTPLTRPFVSTGGHRVLIGESVKMNSTALKP